jgi:hypothetical protein
MEPAAKITISPEELSRMEDTGFLISKRLITEKVYDLFHALKKEITASPVFLDHPFPAEVDILTGKISRGENYKGLPYIIMDFPVYFSQTDIFSFRAMFWWGHEFSFTLHLAGKFMDMYKDKSFHNLFRKGVYQCVNPRPWEYHFDEDNYLPVERFIGYPEAAFMKLSRKLPLADWASVPGYGRESMEIYLRWLQAG